MGIFDLFKRKNIVVSEKETVSNDVLDYEVAVNEDIDITHNEVVSNKEGYAVYENKFIRVKDKNKVYTEGIYVIGKDIELGEYYFWGDYCRIEINTLSPKYIYKGSWYECIDTYAMIESSGEVVIHYGYMTPVDNILYEYTTEDKLIPGHVYRVGIEIPHGDYYLEDDSNSSNKCTLYMYEHPQGDITYSDSDGIAATDALIKYANVKNGIATLKEEILYPARARYQRQIEILEECSKDREIRKFRDRKLKETSKIFKDNYFYIYFSVVEPLAELVLTSILSKYEKLILIPNLSDEDITKNYVLKLHKDNVDKQCLVMYMFAQDKIQVPQILGCSIATVLHRFVYNNVSNEKHAEIFEYLKKYISDNTLEVHKYYAKIYPYQVLDDNYYYKLRVEYKYVYYKYAENRATYAKMYSNKLMQLAEQGLISKKWRNEFNLYLMAKSFYPDSIYQYHTDFLDKQSLDIYIPSINVGLEYQGIQHYEAIDYFGGVESFEERKLLDAIKREKCKTNNVKLIEWHYSKEVTDENFVEILSMNDINVPPKSTVVYDVVIKKEKVKKVEQENKEYVCQFDLEGCFIEKYRTIREAAEKLNISDIMIGRVCSGKNNSAGGFQWKKYFVEDIPSNIPAIEKKNTAGIARIILQLNQEGELIKEYESISEAVRVTGINSKSIRDTANGKQKQAGGYKWVYKE